MIPYRYPLDFLPVSINILYQLNNDKQIDIPRPSSGYKNGNHNKTS